MEYFGEPHKSSQIKTKPRLIYDASFIWKINDNLNNIWQAFLNLATIIVLQVTLTWYISWLHKLLVTPSIKQWRHFSKSHFLAWHYNIINFFFKTYLSEAEIIYQMAFF